MKIKNLKNQPTWSKQTRKYKKYNFERMQVGDLMTLQVEEQGCKDIKSFRALLWNRAKALGFELSCREREDKVWEVYRSK